VRDLTATSEPRRARKCAEKSGTLAEALRAALETETHPKVRNWIEDLLAGDREDVKDQP
jgi:hypothetical protein